MEGNRRRSGHHISVWSLLAVSSGLFSIALWQTHLRLSLSDFTAAGAFWWACDAVLQANMTGRRKRQRDMGD
jgi:hypothetical protein